MTRRSSAACQLSVGSSSDFDRNAALAAGTGTDLDSTDSKSFSSVAYELVYSKQRYSRAEETKKQAAKREAFVILTFTFAFPASSPEYFLNAGTKEPVAEHDQQHRSGEGHDKRLRRVKPDNLVAAQNHLT